MSFDKSLSHRLLFNLAIFVQPAFNTSEYHPQHYSERALNIPNSYHAWSRLAVAFLKLSPPVLFAFSAMQPAVISRSSFPPTFPLDCPHRSIIRFECILGPNTTLARPPVPPASSHGAVSNALGGQPLLGAVSMHETFPPILPVKLPPAMPLLAAAGDVRNQ